MKIKLYHNEFTAPTAWSIEGSDIVKGYITVSLLINKTWIFCFSVSVNNKTFNYRNPFTAIFSALESESIGMSKYQRLKERTRDVKVGGRSLWNRL